MRLIRSTLKTQKDNNRENYRNDERHNLGHLKCVHYDFAFTGFCRQTYFQSVRCFSFLVIFFVKDGLLFFVGIIQWSQCFRKYSATFEEPPCRFRRAFDDGFSKCLGTFAAKTVAEVHANLSLLYLPLSEPTQSPHQ